jgi:hypothetical protein
VTEPDEYVTISAEDCEPGSIGRRLASFLPLHGEGMDCWCEPTLHEREGVQFIEHHVLASDA